MDARTVNFEALEKQPGDEEVRWFSFDPEVRAFPSAVAMCTFGHRIQSLDYMFCPQERNNVAVA